MPRGAVTISVKFESLPYRESLIQFKAAMQRRILARALSSALVPARKVFQNSVRAIRTRNSTGTAASAIGVRTERVARYNEVRGWIGARRNVAVSVFRRGRSRVTRKPARYLHLIDYGATLKSGVRTRAYLLTQNTAAIAQQAMNERFREALGRNIDNEFARVMR